MRLDISSEDYRANPYACFKRFRQQAPICRIKPHGHWAVFSYDAVQWILKNDQLFSSVLTDEELNEDDPQFLFFARSLVGLDAPRHSRLRKLVSQAFKPSLIKQLEHDIREVCQTLADKLASQQPVDFVEKFSMPLPIITIAKLMGLDCDKITTFKRWIDRLLSWRNQDQTTAMMDDIQQMHHYFNQLIANKRQQPQLDLISSLLAEGGITNAEILSLMRLLLVAGTDTTSSLLNHTLLALIENPEQLKQIQNNPLKIPNAIDEALRFNSPTISLIRKATTDVFLSGVPIQQGELVLPLLASANHDETKFSHPEKFDINRPEKNHLALGSGIHYCLGTHLAKLQVRIALEEILGRFNSFQLATNQPLDYLPSFFFRSLCKLPIKLSADCKTDRELNSSFQSLFLYQNLFI